MSAGKLIGVGVGPGDPELMTLKAMRALGEADVIAHFAKAGNESHSRAIAAQHLRAEVIELPLLYPVTTELPTDSDGYRDAIGDFYDGAATAIAAHLDAGRVVAVICEGDPLFYGSYMHLHTRLASRFSAEIVAGVTGMSGCWSAAGMPIAQGDDVFTVLPATLPEGELTRRLADADAAVVMKVGRHLPKLRRALDRSGRLPRAIYVERGTMADAKMIPLTAKSDDDAPYFAVVLVPGWAGRPGGSHERASHCGRPRTGRSALSHAGSRGSARRRGSDLRLRAVSRSRAGARRPKPPRLQQPRGAHTRRHRAASCGAGRACRRGVRRRSGRLRHGGRDLRGNRSRAGQLARARRRNHSRHHRDARGGGADRRAAGS